MAFGIEGHGQGFGDIGFVIDIDMTNPVEVFDHRDF